MNIPLDLKFIAQELEIDFNPINPHLYHPSIPTDVSHELEQ